MQNFSEVMKLLKKAEVKEGSDDYQSDLDLIFDALEFPEKYQTEEAEHNEQFKSLNLIDLAKSAKPASQYMCLKYYKDFKKAAGRYSKIYPYFYCGKIAGVQHSRSYGLDLL